MVLWTVTPVGLVVADTSGSTYIVIQVGMWLGGIILAGLGAAYGRVHGRLGRLERQVQDQATRQAAVVTTEQLQASADALRRHNEERDDKIWEAIDGLRTVAGAMATKADLHREVDRLVSVLSLGRVSRDHGD
jgi:hypothetical protein